MSAIAGLEKEIEKERAITEQEGVLEKCNAVKSMPKQISLRQASKDDGEFLLSVYADSRYDEMHQVTHWSETEKQEFLSFQFNAQDAHYKTHYVDAEYLVIHVNGEDIGRLYIERKQDDIRVMDIAILREYRRRGIARKIMTDILAEAKVNHQLVSLHVEPENVAKQLYLSLGFEVVGEMSFYQKMEWRV